MIAKSEPTVFVVDDDCAVRSSLEQMLSLSKLRVESYGSAEEFLESYDPARSGCLLLDVRMAGMSGLDLQERLLAAGIDLPVIIVSGHGDLAMASRSFRMGAVDFLEKPYDGHVLLERIRSALDKNAKAIQEKAELADISSRIELLSEPERQVMALLVEGRPHKAIAARLGIAARTVEDRRARILAKMNLHSLPELVRQVARWQSWTTHKAGPRPPLAAAAPGGEPGGHAQGQDTSVFKTPPLP